MDNARAQNPSDFLGLINFKGQPNNTNIFLRAIEEKQYDLAQHLSSYGADLSITKQGKDF